MKEEQRNKKIGYLSAVGCYFMWGFQSLYWNIYQDIDTAFLMTSRVIWAGIFCILLLKLLGKLNDYAEVFRNRSIILREFFAALFLAADWVIYLIAVTSGNVLETSLGYYIMPFVVFFFGALIYKEKIKKRHIFILAIIVIGIAFAVNGFGKVPVITISLALCFSVYAAIKKGLGLDPTVSTSVEITICVPFAILYTLIFLRGDNGLASLDLTRLVFLAGSGLVTAAPMLLYAIGLENLPMFSIGIMQYISPTLSIVCAVIMGEQLTVKKLISFIFIITGVVIYLITTVQEEKKSLAGESNTK